MKNIIAVSFCLLGSIVCFSQTYNCPDSLSPIDGTFSNYYVDSFTTKTPVEININSINFHGREIKVDFNYKNEIEYETPLIPISDSVALKFVLSKIQHYGKKQYMYTLSLYYKDGNCWIGNGSSEFMGIVISQEFKLNGSSQGNPDSPYYIRINEGKIKLN